MRHPEPVRGHEIGRLYGAHRQHVLIGPLIAHHPDALDGEKHGEGLGDVAIESGPADLFDDDGIGILQNFHPSGRDLAEDPHREAGTGKRMPPDELLLQAELEPQLAYLVLEELPHRLDQLEAHLLRQPADVVMRLDDGRWSLDRDRLDDVGVERPLHEEVDIRDALCLFLEDGDELVPDPLPLRLGIVDPGQLVVETLTGIDRHDVHPQPFAQPRYDLDGLVLSKQAVVDEDRRELIADRFRHQKRSDRGIDAAADRGDDVAPADGLAYLLDLPSFEVPQIPAGRAAGDVEEKVVDDLRSGFAVRHFRMKLNRVQPAPGVLEAGDRGVA